MAWLLHNNTVTPLTCLTPLGGGCVVVLQEKAGQFTEVNNTLLDQVTNLRHQMSKLATSPPGSPARGLRPSPEPPSSPFNSSVRLSISPDSVPPPRHVGSGAGAPLSPIPDAASFATARGGAASLQPPSMHASQGGVGGGYLGRVSRASPHVPRNRTRDSPFAPRASLGGAATHVSTPSPQSMPGTPQPRDPVTATTPPTQPGGRSAQGSPRSRLPGLEDDAPETLSTALRSTRSALAKALDAISKSWQGVSPPGASGRGQAATAAGGDRSILPPDVLQSTLRTRIHATRG